MYEYFQIATESNRTADLDYNLKDLLKYYQGNDDIQDDLDSVNMIWLKKVGKDYHLVVDTLQNIKYWI